MCVCARARTVVSVWKNRGVTVTDTRYITLKVPAELHQPCEAAGDDWSGFGEAELSERIATVGDPVVVTGWVVMTGVGNAGWDIAGVDGGGGGGGGAGGGEGERRRRGGGVVDVWGYQGCAGWGWGLVDVGWGISGMWDTLAYIRDGGYVGVY